MSRGSALQAKGARDRAAPTTAPAAAGGLRVDPLAERHANFRRSVAAAKAAVAPGRGVVQRVPYLDALTTHGIAAPAGTTQKAAGGELAAAGGLPAAFNPASALVEAGDVPQKKNRIDALAEAARRFGAVGATVRKLQTATPPLPLAWVGGPGNLDPFIYRVAVPYKNPAVKKGSASIELHYQVAPGLNGYVVRQKDTDDKAMSAISNTAPAGAGTAGHSATFNMAHHATAGTPIASLTGQDAKLTKGENEARLDARAKLAGEGARWQCVLHNLGTIRDHSRIWTTVPKTKKVHYVRFDTMWLNWGNVFGGDYNIPDPVVAAKLKTPDIWNGKVHDEKREQFKAAAGDIQV